MENMRVEIPAPRRTRTRVGAIEHTDSGGPGPVLLALHGVMGGYDQAWLLARALLGELGGWRDVAVSRPGYLGTPREIGRTAEEQADALASLLDALAVPRALIAAISAGGPVALHFALRHPDRCAGLVLVSAASGRMPIPPGAAGKLRLMRLLASLPGVPAWLRRRSARDPVRATRSSIPDPAVAARTLAHPEAGPLFRALRSGMFDRLRERLGGTVTDMSACAALAEIPLVQISAPTLLLHGLADPIVPPAHAQAVAAAAPRARFVGLAEGGHVALFTHLEAVRAAFSEFIRQVGR